MLQKNDIIYDGDKREYKILEPLGRGGMGYVLLAERIDDHEKFAVKTLSMFMESDKDYQALSNEAGLASKIRHKNVIFYIYFHDGKNFSELPPYIIMELADKNNLQDLIDEHIKSQEMISQDDLLDLYFKLVDGMEAINKELVHRDIKPANILFKNGELKISDFGIAKIAGDPTRTKSFKGSGTLAFFPPEAFLNQKNTIQMDIYSMGLVFYLLATLKHPYELKEEIHNEDGWKDAHLSTIPPPIQVINCNLSPKISAIVQKMLEKKPEKRFTSWAEIRKELQAINTLESSPYAPTIQRMVSKNIQKKSEEAQKEAERTKKIMEEGQKKKMIQYSFDNDVIGPIKDFIKNYNSTNPDPRDQIKIADEEWGELTIYGPSFSVAIKLHIIDQGDYLSVSDEDVFGRRINQKIEPKLKDKSILAWGYIKENSGKGFNIILCKSENSEYGDWFILTNTHSGFAHRQDSRPDPFPFELDELVEEIHNVGAVHIFNIIPSTLDPQKIIEFISEF
jgi:serine/threonine protein kinase